MPEVIGGNIESITFHLARPNGFTDKEGTLLNGLVRDSLADDYPDYSNLERETLVTESSKRRRNASGGKITPVETDSGNGVSIYRNAIDVVAWDDERDMPVAYLATADNTSSKHNGLYGKAEAEAKMRLDRMSKKRWHWFGMRLIDPTTLHNEAPEDWGSDDRLSILDIMAYLSMINKDPRQQVSTYPWKGESFWVPTITSWGLTDAGDPPKPVYPFGKHQDPVEQSRWTGPSVGYAQTKIENKPGAIELLENLSVADRTI